MKLLVIVPFLNEERYLPSLLASIAAQTRPPERLVLVDDGSSDDSPVIAAAFAQANAYATVLRRPRRPPERDRLSSAPELRAFQWALGQLDERFDLVAKLDGDLRLPPQLFADVERRFRDDEALGMTGAYLSAVGPDGRLRREPFRPDHIRGPNKFYRWQCYEQIAPLPTILGWDTIDEVRARQRGWKTMSFAASGGDPVHLRPLGTYDGRLRGFRRAGEVAWGYGAHPLHVLLGTLSRMNQRPLGLGSLNFLAGWALAALRRRPRADQELRAFLHREELSYARRFILGGGRR
ncbi:MAG: glycosyltransferase family 2 protein [Actinomycetota bacterium]|nr:glycosyltransferase family 2 protein [Actinomycetota bacterium]